MDYEVKIMFSFVYTHPLMERPLKISYIYEYHPYWLLRGDERIKNPEFNSVDGAFLDLKQNIPEAINRFYNKLISIFDCFETIDNIYFCVIPSHDKNSTTSAMHLIAQKLSEHYNRPDYSNALQRYKTIPRLSDGGIRNIGVHINSIRVNQNCNVAGKDIILLDDITTSGSSMAAAYQILKIAGANKVTCLALSHKF